ncbi:uncharacterized protein (DUF58 family) [Rehaibacterium terrae]|uniref:Uncharacterized protein (DUF58 family) n=1 Tax=Rehaibacterium terrae TaxID=1341696 RepID=A0A7W7XZF3_9GAMM|nr:uncharacterized protein (DUF58 family) [Rehaibacterium terrae]
MLAALRSRRDALADRLGRWARPRAPEPLPIHIDRRRIYVLPTGFGLFVAGLLATMLLGALNYNNNPALLLGFLLAAAAHNSLVRAHLHLSGIRLTALGAEPVHAGEVLHLRLRFEAAPRRRRHGLALRLGTAEAWLDLSGDDAAEACLALPAPRRGWQRLDRLRLSTRQPHGFAVAWCWLWPDTRLLVYPALESRAPPLPVDGGEGTLAHRRDLGEQLHHLRDYRSGDPLRQVAWKASARADRLLVREYEGRAGREVHLDWNTLTGLGHEERIRRLARWVVEAERHGLRYRLSLPGQSLGPALGPAHRHACLRALALLPDG